MGPAGVNAAPDKAGNHDPVPTVTYSDAGFATVDTVNTGGSGSGQPSAGRCGSLPLKWQGEGKRVSWLSFTNVSSLRAGLIHLACGEAGLALPKELLCLRYEMVYVEVDEDTTGVHAIVAKLFGSY